MSHLTEQIDQIAIHVSRYGIERSEPQLRRLATLARTFQVEPAISSLLTDTSAADVVRSRAFSRVVVGLRAVPAAPLSIVA